VVTACIDPLHLLHKWQMQRTRIPTDHSVQLATPHHVASLSCALALSTQTTGPVPPRQSDHHTPPSCIDCLTTEVTERHFSAFGHCRPPPSSVTSPSHRSSSSATAQKRCAPTRGSFWCSPSPRVKSCARQILSFLHFGIRLILPL
jgi:hypothetical protein